MQTSYTKALWFGGTDKTGLPVYVHGEYKDRAGGEWLRANKGDAPTRYTFGVKRQDIVWLAD